MRKGYENIPLERHINGMWSIESEMCSQAHVVWRHMAILWDLFVWMWTEVVNIFLFNSMLKRWYYLRKYVTWTCFQYKFQIRSDNTFLVEVMFIEWKWSYAAIATILSRTNNILCALFCQRLLMLIIYLIARDKNDYGIVVWCAKPTIIKEIL